MNKCEWPVQIGAIEKCGRSAITYMTSTTPNASEPLPWGRHVCGIHRRRAITIGWEQTDK